MTKPIEGFSKFSKSEKINWLAEQYFSNPAKGKKILENYWNKDKKLQQLHDEFIENTISNYYLPLGVAPNFLINGKKYVIPMAIEESSVVAAAAKAGKFWYSRGGFKAEVLSVTKNGHVHFMFDGNPEDLEAFFTVTKSKLLEDTLGITRNMQKRGGGILDIVLINKTEAINNYYQLFVTFNTKDAMGANFINSCLEQIARTWVESSKTYKKFIATNAKIKVVMSILSNYMPSCLVRAEVSCKVEALNEDKEIAPQEFAEKFVLAIQIAEKEPYRAVTHNKGIMNGVDAVVLATGNDFRAVEAGVHAYASKNGTYTSLTHATVKDGIFKFWIEIPLALGTVGGLTSLHPLVKLSLEILQKPNAQELMKIVAVAGLAQNFGAIRSLITSGIQQGHMKMHLMNILNQLEATNEQKKQLVSYFKNRIVSYSVVIEAFDKLKT